ncbi:MULTISPECIES: carbohydrate deacetylase [unclassified Carboxydocella]|uniref:carbohydrate deacetylase n=1 Tax=unclassified Carboxydocella TaxID=2685367 RepID=UPI0009AC01C9|nr:MULTISPECIES: carbohydrate deacetylase [unclassified Carboxydocella]GAW28035.1 carbohydrate deacetylase [Carboxydocella sp. ULO1]GAW31698.1 carbohydrate deacetylase [Carboxydocella sp. JDF658]
MSKWLIVNGDDFGLSPGINEGVRRCHREGILTSTTILVNQPWAREAVDLSRECPALEMGVHLNLTVGKALTDGRQFEPYPVLYERLQRASAEEIARFQEWAEAEWLAQIQTARSWGLELSHLDSHHHVHGWPWLRPVALHLARLFDLPLRAPQEEAKAFFRQQGVATPDFFVEHFFGAGVTRENFEKILQGMAAGFTEVMTHPAVPDWQLLAISSYTENRGRELEILRWPGWQEIMAELGITPGHWRDIMRNW